MRGGRRVTSRRGFSGRLTPVNSPAIICRNKLGQMHKGRRITRPQIFCRMLGNPNCIDVLDEERQENYRILARLSLPCGVTCMYDL